MHILLDIGAFDGEFTHAMMDHDIHHAHCFEPSPHYVEHLNKRFAHDDDVTIHPVALDDHDGTAHLYYADTPAATLFQEKRNADYTGSDYTFDKIASVQVRRASTWITSNTSEDDALWIKLNCEGSEAPILRDILPLLPRIHSIFVDFDSLKIPGMEGERDEILDLYPSDLIIESIDLDGTPANRAYHWVNRCQ